MDRQPRTEPFQHMLATVTFRDRITDEVCVEEIHTCDSGQLCSFTRASRWRKKFHHIVKGHKRGVTYEGQVDRELYVATIHSHRLLRRRLSQTQGEILVVHFPDCWVLLSETPFKDSRAYNWHQALKMVGSLYVHGYRGQAPRRLESRKGGAWANVEKCPDCRSTRKMVHFARNQELSIPVDGKTYPDTDRHYELTKAANHHIHTLGHPPESVENWLRYQLELIYGQDVEGTQIR